MSAPIFVDTNVLVYAHQLREPVKRPAAIQWLERLWQEQLGRLSMQVLNEYYVTVTRKIRPARTAADAWDEVRELLSWKPQPTDSELLHRAREVEQRHQLSWWDSLIVGAAQLQDCALLLTEDLQHRAVYGSVTVQNPFMAAVSEDAAVYAVTRTSIGGHPRRGRPRRNKAARG
jgi:predicted nucleic acid-binding protein